MRCLDTSSNTSLRTYLLTYLITHILTYIHTYLPTYIHTYTARMMIWRYSCRWWWLGFRLDKWLADNIYDTVVIKIYLTGKLIDENENLVSSASRMTHCSLRMKQSVWNGIEWEPQSRGNTFTLWHLIGKNRICLLSIYLVFGSKQKFPSIFTKTAKFHY